MVTSDKELWRQEVGQMKQKGMTNGQIACVLGQDDGFLGAIGLGPNPSSKEIDEYVVSGKEPAVRHIYPKSDFRPTDLMCIRYRKYFL